MEEIWKDIYYTDSITREFVDYRGLYQISNLGRVKSLARFVIRTKNDNGHLLSIPGKILAHKTNGVYPTVCLWKGNKAKYLLVHRLVASMFVPNPNGYPEINHIDENPLNPIWTNLEWCEHDYNFNYGNHNKKLSSARKRKVSQYSISGELIKEWNGLTDAAKTLGLNRGNISNCALGHCKSYGGFIWRYAD